MARINSNPKNLLGYAALHRFDAKPVMRLSSVCTMPEGLMVEAAHDLDDPLLMSEIGEAKRLEVFIPTENYRRWQHEWEACIERAIKLRDGTLAPDHPSLRGVPSTPPGLADHLPIGALFTFDIGEAQCLALDVSATSSERAIDRVLFRKFQLVSRRAIGPDVAFAKSWNIALDRE